MTLKEILDLKEQGYSLDEIEKINNILESTGAEDDPKPEDGPKPEDDPKPEDGPKPEDDPEPEDDPKPEDDPEPDYKKMYEDLKAETEKKAAHRDRGNEDVAQDNLQEAVAAYFKNIFT